MTTTAASPKAMATKRQRYWAVKNILQQDRSTFEPHWKELSEYIKPRRTRFFTNDANKGDKRMNKIINCTATFAARTLASGMMSGVTSPARPWFRLAVDDAGIADQWDVKAWLQVVTERMQSVFIKSNLYNVLPIVYGDMGTFGTGAVMIEEDFEQVIRLYSFPIGSFWIANDETGKVRVFYREFQMTVRQLLGKFAEKDRKGRIKNWEAFSSVVKSAYERGEMDRWIDVCHIILPNDEYDASRIEAKHKKFASCYFERGGGDAGMEGLNQDDQDKYLRESGYDYFPVLVPRWEVTGEDVWGTDCPGMTALGDIKQLQLGEKLAAKGIEKMVNPPMVGPTSLRAVRVSGLPGDLTTSDAPKDTGLRPIYEVNPRIAELEQKQSQIMQRVSRAFYEDLFLMLASDPRVQPSTAREIQERHEEKLLALGPVLEQLNQDMLDPLIDITFIIMLAQGLIPEVPEALKGRELKVLYVSIMSQAQKLIGVAGLDRFAGFVAGVVGQTQDPSHLDMVDIDKMIEEYADAVGVDPRLIRADDVVAKIRADRAAQQQQAQQAQLLQAGAKTAKDLASAPMDEDNALTQLLSRATAGQIAPTR